MVSVDILIIIVNIKKVLYLSKICGIKCYKFTRELSIDNKKVLTSTNVK